MKERHSHRLVAVLSVAIATLVARPAAADVAAEAKESFDSARTLRLQGDCASAIPLFRKAFELYPVALGSLRNLAECEEALGNLTSAQRAWMVLGRALKTNPNPNYEGWEEDADQGTARTAAKLAALDIDHARGPREPPASSSPRSLAGSRGLT